MERNPTDYYYFRSIILTKKNRLLQMKKLINLLFFISLAAISINAGAQVTIRLNAGLNLTNVSSNSDLDTDINFGVPVGLTAEFGAGKYMSVETGLIRSPKGFKSSTFEETENGTIEKRLRFNPIYYEVPAAAKFIFQKGDFRIFGKAGLYLALGAGGSRNTKHFLDGSETGKEIDQISWGPEGNDDLRRIDYGLLAGAGCGFRTLQLELFYEHGLPDASPNLAEWQELRNRVFGISLALTLSNY